LRVVGLDIRPPPSFDTNRWTGLSCDVAEEQAWATVMNGIVRDLGAPDILVNAAGVSGLGQQDPASAKAWTETLRTDLIGSWLGMRTVLPHMTARGSGAIVNIGALATQQPFPLAGLGAYTAAKKPESRRSRARRRWKSPLRVLRSTASRLDRSRRR
jgi:NADP-dependent 3-hydroxy acid dehydrogenase YdfG